MISPSLSPIVIPADAGIQLFLYSGQESWIPASAGMTGS
jgi:hypothetical protein